MPDVRTLGSVNLRDAAKYRIPAASEAENQLFESVWNPIRNSKLINLGMVDPVATELTMDIWVTGDDWQAVMTNYAAIQTQLTNAATYAIQGTGSPVTYIEQNGNQSSPTTYTVKWGRFPEDRPRRLVARLRRVGHLYLFCQPL